MSINTQNLKTVGPPEASSPILVKFPGKHWAPWADKAQHRPWALCSCSRMQRAEPDKCPIAQNAQDRRSWQEGVCLTGSKHHISLRNDCYSLRRVSSCAAICLTCLLLPRIRRWRRCSWHLLQPAKPAHTCDKHKPTAPRAACPGPGTELRAASDLDPGQLLRVHPLKLPVGEDTSGSQSSWGRIWGELSPWFTLWVELLLSTYSTSLVVKTAQESRLQNSETSREEKGTKNNQTSQQGTEFCQSWVHPQLTNTEDSEVLPWLFSPVFFSLCLNSRCDTYELWNNCLRSLSYKQRQIY